MTQHRHPWLAAAAVLPLALVSQGAHALGTAAGTLITNTASGTFTNGTTTSSVQSNTVSVRVDEVLDVTVVALNTSAAQIGGSAVAVPFRITNTGNGPEAFKVTVAGALPGNQFTPTVTGLVLDTNGNKTYDPGIDQPLLAGAATPALGANATLDAFAIVTLPAGVTDGQAAQLRLTAEAATGSGAPGTSFAGKGQGGGDAVVGASTALANAASPLVASSIAMTITKSATVLDPYGTAKIIPGAVVTFQLAVAFTGSGSASGARVTDTIPPNTTYQPGTLKLDGTGLSDVADGDAGAASAAGIDVNLGTVSGGTTRQVRFDVKIN